MFRFVFDLQPQVAEARSAVSQPSAIDCRCSRCVNQHLLGNENAVFVRAEVCRIFLLVADELEQRARSRSIRGRSRGDRISPAVAEDRPFAAEKPG
jgi:hypothetical protein